MCTCNCRFLCINYPTVVYYRPQKRSSGQGNVFMGVCPQGEGLPGGGCLHPKGGRGLYAEGGGRPPKDMVNERAECILVYWI